MALWSALDQPHGSGSTLSHLLLGGLRIDLGAVKVGCQAHVRVWRDDHGIVTDVTMAQGWYYCHA